MANDFKVGDWVTWKFSDGKPDQIEKFGWQRQTAFLSRQAKIGVPVTELSPAKAPIAVEQPVLAAIEPNTGIEPNKPWTPAPPKGH